MTAQYGRQANLFVQRPEVTGNNPSAYVAPATLDLSRFRFRFQTTQQDVESPNTCNVRVYNISRETAQTLIKGEFSRLVLQAGYAGQVGVIFDGTIKQFRIGRENATTTFIDLLAADGDAAYNFAVVNKTLAAGWTQNDVLKEATSAMKEHGATTGQMLAPTGGTIPNPRGKVAFGMARVFMRRSAQALGCTWQINNGAVNVLPLQGYMPGEAVKLTAATGLIGMPEQTNEGILARVLLNPRIVVGGLVQIDNRSINQIIQQNPAAAPLAYNRYATPQFLATVTVDGIYRVFVAEHEGDSRENEWYTKLTCLAVDSSTKKVVAQ